MEEHSSVKQASQQSQKPVVGTLDECFTTYTQEERVGSPVCGCVCMRGVCMRVCVLGAQASQQSQKPVVGTLDECFTSYTQEERVGSPGCVCVVS